MTDEALLDLLSRTGQHRALSDGCYEAFQQLQGVADNTSLITEKRQVTYLTYHQYFLDIVRKEMEEGRGLAHQIQ